MYKSRFFFVILIIILIHLGCTSSNIEVIEYKAQNLSQLMLDAPLFTAYTDNTGEWIPRTGYVWTSGFVPGIFWYLSKLSNDDKWEEYAKAWTEGLKSRATATHNDTGFQIFNSFGLGYTIGENSTREYKDIIITAADTMVIQRYNPNIGCFKSWRHDSRDPYSQPFEVIIDQLMNMELILWVANETGNSEYKQYAINHADNTWENHIREDNSSYHVVHYHPDGTVDLKRTHQGWMKESTWSRGQAWAVYAYIMYYRYTGLERMLERSIKTYNYFIGATAKQSDDNIPYSDFNAPIDDKNPRDSSAAAIVASASLELYKVTGESIYLENAEKIILSLSKDEFFSRDRDYDSILLKGSEKWGTPEVGTIFGDYYFLEALYRWEKWLKKGS